MHAGELLARLVDMVLFVVIISETSSPERLHLPALLCLSASAHMHARTHTGTHARTRMHYDSSRELQRRADFCSEKAEVDQD